MKLISMILFVLEQSKIRNEINVKAEKEERIDWMIDANYNYIEKTEKYADLLIQPLTLGMFVPVSAHGNLLNEPVNYSAFEVGMSGKDFSFNFIDCQEYKEAKERVLILGFNFKYSDKFVTTVSNERLWFNFKSKNIFVNDKLVYTIEDVVKYQLVLTESAIKQIGCQ